MVKKRVWTIIAIMAILGSGLIIYKQIIPDKYVPALDEIALYTQMDTKEDVGLLVYDYRADDFQGSGGISNANKSLIKHNSYLNLVWNRQELNSSSENVELSIQFRIITEYESPNYENIYPKDITKYLEPISWKANFGESYHIIITGDKLNGYKALLK